MGKMLWVDETLDRLVEGDTGRSEDRQDHEQPSELLAPDRAQEERDPKRQSRQSITTVVDQVRKQRHRVRKDKDHELCCCGHGEYTEADRYRLDPLMRTHDRAIDEPMRMRMTRIVPVMLLGDRLRSVRRKLEVTMRTGVRMAMQPAAMSVKRVSARRTHSETT